MKRAPRVLFVGNFLVRHWGNGRSGIDMRLAAGAIRNGWQALTFSERDIARFLAPLGFMRGIGAKMMNDRLVKTARNWKPDFVFIAHCDYVTNEALHAIREVVPGVKLVHINCDPVETEHCCDQIRRRMESCDAIFVTTAGDKLKEWTTGRNVVGFYPNPSDPSYETEDNSLKTEFRYDLFFAGRPADADQRKALLAGLMPKIDPKVRLGFFGMGRPLVVGRAYEEAIAESKMGLSINRFEGWKWYASDRLTHLMGNGLLSFQYDGNSMQDFFTKDETVYFHDVGDLAEKISFYNTHDDARRVLAAAGMRKYRRLFEARRVLRYMVVATGTDPCDTVDVIRSGKLWYNIRHEEVARKQAQQGVSPDRPDSPQDVLPGCRRAGGMGGTGPNAANLRRLRAGATSVWILSDIDK